MSRPAKHLRDTRLMVRYDMRKKDILYYYPKSRADSRLMHWMLSNRLTGTPGEIGKSVIEELEERGYDITTLKFSISLKSDLTTKPESAKVPE